MYFLIEHNRITKETHIEEFEDYEMARKESLRREIEFDAAMKQEMEVVVFEAESLEHLQKTHSRYFNETKESLMITLKIIGTVGAIGAVALAVYLLTKKK